MAEAAEEWRAVEGWPYEVSDLGRVRRIGGRVLAPRLHTNGYIRVQLCANGEQQDQYVHRLVCRAFHGEPPFSGAEVDHADRVRSNNRVANLRWASVAENRALRTVHRGDGHANAKLSAASVKAIRASDEPTATLASRFSVAPRTIRDARAGKLWRHVDA